MSLDPYATPRRQTLMAIRQEFAASIAVRRPEAFMCITGLVDVGPLQPVDESLDRDLVLFIGERMLTVPRGARDRYGHVPALLRQHRPRPLYTRHTLGERELARDVRRRRRGRRV